LAVFLGSGLDDEAAEGFDFLGSGFWGSGIGTSLGSGSGFLGDFFGSGFLGDGIGTS
jgi:hypothetical protein